MSSTSKLDAVFGLTWHAAADRDDPSVASDGAVVPMRPGKPSGNAVFFIQSSGADLFPGKERVKAFLKRLGLA